MGNKLKLNLTPEIALNSEIMHKKIAIDGTLMLHQVLYAHRIGSTGEYFRSKSGVITSHIYGLTSRLTPFIRRGAKLVFVMDGKRNPLKISECKRRAQQTELKLQMLMEYIAQGQENCPDAIKIKKSINYITEDILKTTKKLITLMGGIYHVAKQEAEAECADLVNRGLCDMVWSDDSDTALYFKTANAKWLKKIKIVKSGEIFGQILTSGAILKSLNMSQSELIDVAIMAGTDYSSGIFKVGPVNGQKLIKKYKNLKTIVAEYDSSKLSNIGPWQKIQKNFKLPQVSGVKKIKYPKPHIFKLSEFLQNHDISLKKIRQIILSIRK